MADYRAELEAFLKTLPPKPVLLGHSMGGVLAQQLAARGSRPCADSGRARAALRHPAADRRREAARPGPDGARRLLEDGDQSRFRSRPHLHLEPRAGSRAARRVRQIRARIGPRLLRAVLLDVRSDRRDRGRHRSRQMPGAMHRRRGRQDRLAADRARDRGGLSRRDLLGARRPRPHARARARRRGHRPPHRRVDPGARRFDDLVRQRQLGAGLEQPERALDRARRSGGDACRRHAS